MGRRESQNLWIESKWTTGSLVITMIRAGGTTNPFDEGYMHLNRETASAVASSYVSTYIAMRDRYSFAEDIWSGYQFLEK
jgi:hypothetical protein